MLIYADDNMPYAREFFSQLGEVRLFSGRTVQPVQLQDAEVLLVRSVTKVSQALITACPKLQFVGTATIGIDHVDVAALQHQAVGFSSAPGCNAQSVLEYVLSSIFMLAEKYQWDLCSKTVGVVGVGNIGRLVVRGLQALGLKVLQCDPVRAEQEPDFPHLDLAQLLPQVDLLSLHVPLVRQGRWPTEQLIGSKELKQLKANCALINACRGEVVNNQALLAEAQFGQHRPLVLDVWANEPDILQELVPYCDIATAHIAGHSVEGKARGTEMLYQSLCQQLRIPPQLTLKQVLPEPQFAELKINSNFSLLDVQNLTRLLYDVRRDDALFRLHLQHKGFDWLRKSYPARREYSSLRLTGTQVPTYLKELGFSSQ